MAMKLAALKRLFHPVWDTDAEGEEVEIRFLAPGAGSKWELTVKDTSYDVAKKLWTVDLSIAGPSDTANDPPPEVAPVAHQHGTAGPHSHESDEAAAPQPDGVPVADEPSDD